MSSPLSNTRRMLSRHAFQEQRTNGLCLLIALPWSADRSTIDPVPEPTQEEHFASAASRHFHDGDYLRKGRRLPSADHLYGFAAERAVESLLLASRK